MRNKCEEKLGKSTKQKMCCVETLLTRKFSYKKGTSLKCARNYSANMREIAIIQSVKDNLITLFGKANDI